MKENNLFYLEGQTKIRPGDDIFKAIEIDINDSPLTVRRANGYMNYTIYQILRNNRYNVKYGVTAELIADNTFKIVEWDRLDSIPCIV